MIGTGLLPGRVADLAMAYGTYFVSFVLLAAAVGLFARWSGRAEVVTRANAALNLE